MKASVKRPYTIASYLQRDMVPYHCTSDGPLLAQQQCECNMQLQVPRLGKRIEVHYTDSCANQDRASREMESSVAPYQLVPPG